MDKRNSRVAAAIAAAGIEPSIRILDADAKTAVAAAELLYRSSRDRLADDLK